VALQRRDILAALAWAAALLLCIFVVDERVIHWYRELHTPAWFRTAEDLGSRRLFEVLWPAGLIALLVFAGGAHRLRWLAYGAGALAGQWVIVHALKPVMGRLRPCDAGDPLMWMGPSALFESFPSGHSATVWTLAFVLGRRWRSGRPLFFATALFVCWARIEADAHYVSDLLAGAAIGWMVERCMAALVPMTNTEPAERAPMRRGGAARALALNIAVILIGPAAGVLALTRTSMLPGHRVVLAARDQAAIASQVRSLYLLILAREPDDAGAAAYAARLTQAPMLLPVMREMLLSGEFARRIEPLDADDRIGVIYRCMLAREPDESERAWARAAFGRTADPAWALRSIVLRIEHSAEYRSLVLCPTTPHDSPEQEGF